MQSDVWRVRVLIPQRGGINVRGEKILIYWPHGVGDWVFLAYVLPFLPPENQYWITRFGDDSVSLFEGNRYVRIAYTGIKSPHCADGGDFGMRHFGLNLEATGDVSQEMRCPLSLHNLCRNEGISHLFFRGFPETHGFASVPYQTKARFFLKENGMGEALAADPYQPLRNTNDFDLPETIARWVEARLRSAVSFGRNRLCIITRVGYTSLGKNWGYLWRGEMPRQRQHEAAECRDFIRLMLQHDPRWSFLVMEDRIYSGYDTMHDPNSNCFSFAKVFAPVDGDGLPFGLLARCLVRLADLSIGVPAGPFHLSMARPDLPVVGIWLEHMPHWYDEPRSLALHILGKNIRESRVDDRVGSREGIGHRMIKSESRIVSGVLAFETARQVLSDKESNQE